MRVAVVGGGINGAGIAWELARKDYQVTLYDKGRCGAQTSSKTTKMVHGGIRYLENLHFRLVRESLNERAWLLEQLPQLVRPVEILLPLYADSPRSRLTVRAGLILYDLLAGRRNIAPHRRWSIDELTAHVPLRRDGLRGGFSFRDAQVDDYALVRAVVAAAAREGAAIREETAVIGLQHRPDRWVVTSSDGDAASYDFLVNAAGPWMNELLGGNAIHSRYQLSLIRGSHLVLARRLSDSGLLLQSVSDRRVFFVLPWKGTTLVGTTEVVHHASLDDVQPSEDELDYLIQRYNHYLAAPIGRADVASTFAGVRPLVGRAASPSAIGREYRVARRGNMINVFGGKLTTFRSLAHKVGMRVDNHFGRPRPARQARFHPTDLHTIPPS